MTTFEKVNIEHIVPDQNQPRQFYDEDSMQELVESIKNDGILQPILLRPIDGLLMIVFGERRYRAAKAAGLTEIPAMVRVMTDEEALQAQIVENLQRKDVHPMEEAVAFKSFLEQKKWSVDEVAARVGKSVYYVRQRLKLSNLVEDFRAYFFRGVINNSFAVKLAALSEDAQNHILDANREYLNKGENSIKQYEIDHVLSMLNDARFDITDAELYPKAGACTTCQFNSAVMQLFPESDGKARCSNMKCFAYKNDLSFEREIERVRLEPGVLFFQGSWMSEKDQNALVTEFEKKGLPLVKYNDLSDIKPADGPEKPDYQEYLDDLNNGFYDDEEEMKEAFQEAMEEYEEELTRFEEIKTSPEYIKAFSVSGSKKGKYCYVKLHKNDESDGDVAETAPQDETSRKIAAIKAEIYSINDKEKRSVEISQNKIWEDLKPLFSPEENAGVITGELTDLEMKAMAAAMYQKLNYYQQRSFRELFGWNDYEGKMYLTPTKEQFYKMCRFFFFDIVPPAVLYRGFSKEALLSIELGRMYFPKQITEIELTHEEKNQRRIERVQKRLDELNTELSSLTNQR